MRYRRAAAELAAVEQRHCAIAGREAVHIEPVRWFRSTRPSDPVLEELVAEVVMATRPPGSLADISGGDADRLADWLASEVPAGKFDRVRDRGAVREQARLLLEVEGWDLKKYLACEDGLRRLRTRGAELFAAAFSVAAERRGIGKIPVYRALSVPMKPEQGLRCVSWNPRAHIAEPPYLYQAWIRPPDVVAISVNIELHPVVAGSPDLRWKRIRLPGPQPGEVQKRGHVAKHSLSWLLENLSPRSVGCFAHGGGSLRPGWVGQTDGTDRGIGGLGASGTTAAKRESCGTAAYKAGRGVGRRRPAGVGHEDQVAGNRRC